MILRPPPTDAELICLGAALRTKTVFPSQKKKASPWKAWIATVVLALFLLGCVYWIFFY